MCVIDIESFNMLMKALKIRFAMENQIFPTETNEEKIQIHKVIP